MRAVRARRMAAATWLVLASTGCTVWKVDHVSPRELLKNPNVTAVRVTKPDSSKVELYDVKLSGDSLVGHPTPRAVLRVFVPLSRVQAIESKHKSIGRTLLIGLGAAAAIAAYALLQTLNPPSI